MCGGMPEAVEQVLQDILDLYKLDFAKYATPRDIPRIHLICYSLPSQLAKENRKFIFKVVKPGARSKDYKDALLWLENAGMIYRVSTSPSPDFLFLPMGIRRHSTYMPVALDCFAIG